MSIMKRILALFLPSTIKTPTSNYNPKDHVGKRVLYKTWPYFQDAEAGYIVSVSDAGRVEMTLFDTDPKSRYGMKPQTKWLEPNAVVIEEVL